MSVEYLLRYSKRAKHLHLRICSRGLEVVVPTRKKIPLVFIEQFVLEKEAWIKRNLTRAQQLYGQPKSAIALPDKISLQAINELWTINYIPTPSSKISLIANQSNELALIGNVKNTHLCIKKLKRWIVEIACHALKQHLDTLSFETGLHYDKCSIRNNSSRWGSCSNQRTISLCCKLLFLPRHLMTHVLFHELCHTKVMNHGKRFWQLLEGFDPAARIHAKQLKLSNQWVPTWMR